jgi:Zn-dependent protease with chaperone function
MNHFKTFILIAAMTALFMVIGFMIGGPAGMGLAFVFAAGMNLFTYWNADAIVLRTYHAREVETDDPNPQVRQYVADVEAWERQMSLTRPDRYHKRLHAILVAINDHHRHYDCMCRISPERSRPEFCCSN